MGSQKTFEFWDSPDASGDAWGLDCEFIAMDNPTNWQCQHKSEEEKEQIKRRARALTAGMRCSHAEKIDFSVRCIRKAFKLVDQNKWSLSWSAGNDSTALSLLMTEVVKTKVVHIMSNTRLEYPETIRNMHMFKMRLESTGVQVIIAYPDKRPHEVWKEDGIPLFSKDLASKYRQWIRTKNDNHLKHVPESLIEPFRRLRDAGIMLTEKCCDELKKKPMKAARKKIGAIASFTGVRASESRSRRLGFIQRGALYNSTRNRQWICNPMIHWSEEDVQKILDRFGVKLERPGNGTGRSGCVNCGFGCHIETEKNSLQHLYETNIVMWNRTMKEWGFEEACVVAGVKTKPEGGDSREDEKETRKEAEVTSKKDEEVG